MRKTIAYVLGTYEDWGGASRALLNFVWALDRAKFRPVIILTRTGELSKNLTEEKIDWLVWDIHERNSNILGYTIQIFRAYRMLKQQKIDLIHMNYGFIGWKPPEILAARLARIPIISHYHNRIIAPSSYLRYSSAVVAVSRFIAENSTTLGVPTRAIHNISNLRRFAHGRDIRVEFGFDTSHTLFVYMGQMIRAKGIDVLVEAFRQVPLKNARLLLAGAIRNTEGAYTEDEVKALASTDSRILYIGYRADAENLYKTADVMVMPSQWDEPCAMIIFEAAAAGRPLVATATGGTAEYLRDGETGFLVPRGDAVSLGVRLAQLAENPELRQLLGARAAAIATEFYAHGPVKQMESLYDDLLARHG